MKRTILGARIRERRRAIGMTQAQLAHCLGISASYMNLIERNKRSIAGTLLRRAADALAIPLEQLDGAVERRLLGTLDELAHMPEIAALGVEGDGAGEFIGRFPGWAKAVAALARSEREATDIARTYSDRLSHDPFLGECVHRMLSQIAAVRSAADILVSYGDIDKAKQAEFHHIIHVESCKLTQVGEALATYFDNNAGAQRVLTPLDEVEAMFAARDNHFEELEVLTLPLTAKLATTGLSRRQHANELIAQYGSDTIDSIIGQQPQIATQAAKTHAREALVAYAINALLLPLAHFADTAQIQVYDAEVLSELFAVDFPTICQRLAALPKTLPTAPATATPSFGYFAANAAGTIIESRSITGLDVPRYSSACPLWVLFRAQQTPYMVLRQRVLLPSGARFVFIARARQVGAAGFAHPRHYLTDMLLMSEADASHTVYGPDPSVAVETVGTACRSCPRRNCTHRTLDPLTG